MSPIRNLTVVLIVVLTAVVVTRPMSCGANYRRPLPASVSIDLDQQSLLFGDNFKLLATKRGEFPRQTLFAYVYVDDRQVSKTQWTQENSTAYIDLTADWTDTKLVTLKVFPGDDTSGLPQVSVSRSIFVVPKKSVPTDPESWVGLATSAKWKVQPAVYKDGHWTSSLEINLIKNGGGKTAQPVACPNPGLSLLVYTSAARLGQVTLPAGSSSCRWDLASAESLNCEVFVQPMVQGVRECSAAITSELVPTTAELSRVQEQGIARLFPVELNLLLLNQDMSPQFDKAVAVEYSIKTVPEQADVGERTRKRDFERDKSLTIQALDCCTASVTARSLQGSATTELKIEFGSLAKVMVPFWAGIGVSAFIGYAVLGSLDTYKRIRVWFTLPNRVLRFLLSHGACIVLTLLLLSCISALSAYMLRESIRSVGLIRSAPETCVAGLLAGLLSCFSVPMLELIKAVSNRKE